MYALFSPVAVGEAIIGLFRARKTPVWCNVLGSPDDLSPTVFPGFRREARLTHGL